jgi:hypothetical protein
VSAIEPDEKFDAADMQRRWEKLKADGKVPPLEYLLSVIARVKAQSDADAATFTPRDKKTLKKMGVKP